jgi:uncharacterized protein
MPAILKILIIFFLMLVMTRIRFPLGASLVCGGIAVNLWAGLGLAPTAVNLGKALINPEMWLILIMMTMIIDLSRFMTKEKNAAEIVSAARRWGGRHGAAFTIMAMPAVIGLIPMPAGAIFSAPFVKEPGERIGGSPEWKTAVNYWFRHVWEYWWPLYPGVIIAMSLFSMIPTWQFMLVQCVFTPATIIIGYYFLIRPYKSKLAQIREQSEGSLRRTLFLLLPIAIVITSAMVLPPVLNQLSFMADSTIRKFSAMVIGLLVALLLVARDEARRGEGGTLSSVFKPKSIEVMVSLIGVLVFKYMLIASSLLPLAGRELADYGIPVVMVAIVLPFVAGLVTGVAMGFTGTAFPLVVALLVSGSSDISPLSALVLAYGFGYMGMMVTPIHLCFIVTKDYFSASFRKVYPLISPCVLSMALVFLVVHGVLRLCGW